LIVDASDAKTGAAAANAATAQHNEANTTAVWRMLLSLSEV
jgi:hypothetical protein